MILGATNFLVLNGLLTGKIKKVAKQEFLTFIVFILIATLFVWFYLGIDIETSFFHVVSATSTTGFSYINLSQFEIPAKVLIIFLMLVGGCSLSTAGGIKIFRLLLFLKSIPYILRRMLDKEIKMRIDEREISDFEIAQHFLIILLYIILISVSAFLLTFNGFPYIDSLFEVTSAIATTGLTIGITSISLPIPYKWLLVLLMVLGRVEIVPFLLSFIKSPKDKEGGV